MNKINRFIRAVQKVQSPEYTVRKSSQIQISPTHHKIQDLKYRVQASNSTTMPFNHDTADLKEEFHNLQQQLQESQKLYSEHIQKIHTKLDHMTDQQLEEHQSRLKQNKLIAIKSHIISMEKRLESLRQYHRPRLLQAAESKLEDLKQRYERELKKDTTIADVTADVITSPNLTHKEILLPLSVPIKAEMDWEGLQKEIAEQPIDLDLPDFLPSSDELELPHPIPSDRSAVPVPVDMPDPPRKHSFLDMFKHKK